MWYPQTSIRGSGVHFNISKVMANYVSILVLVIPFMKVWGQYIPEVCLLSQIKAAPPCYDRLDFRQSQNTQFSAIRTIGKT